MNQPTYQQQFDKLTTAYIGMKVRPMENCACFIGNLLNNSPIWNRIRGIATVNDELISYLKQERTLACITGEIDIAIQSGGLYTPKDIVMLESVFLTEYKRKGGLIVPGQLDTINEDALFSAFSLALDKLKELHISKGEIITEAPVLVKREMKTAVVS